MFLNNNSPSLSSTFASVMPRWIRAAFFDPETERSRIEVQSQQTCAKEMRKMTGCRLLDSMEIPLKKFKNFFDAAQHAKGQGLEDYLKKFVCSQPGDLPAQFCMRQV